MIVIIANEFDIHVDSVIFALQELNYKNYLRIDLETVFDRFDFGIEITNDSYNWFLQSKSDKNLIIYEDSIKSIWWRRASSYFNTNHIDLPNSDTLDNVESYWTIRYLFESFHEKFFPLGHPIKMRTANNKIKQLEVAKQVGFKLPESILTNNKNFIENSSLKSKEKLVIKSIHSTIVLDSLTKKELSLKTSLNNKDEIFKKLEESDSFNVFTQTAIDKIADIRITVINNNIIACKLDTSTLLNTEVDWRKNTFEFEHEIIELPDDIKIKIYEFLKFMDIKAGYFDFGLDINGNYTFFECNPNAQWLWIEFKTKYKISHIIAEALINKNITYECNSLE